MFPVILPKKLPTKYPSVMILPVAVIMPAVFTLPPVILALATNVVDSRLPITVLP